MAQQSSNKKQNLIIIFGAVLYVLLIVGTGLFLWAVNDYKDRQEVNNPYIPTVWVPTQYSEMTPEQISYKLQQDTGLTVEGALTVPVNKEYIGSFEKAYSTAQAMYYLNYTDKSVEIYTFADTFDSQNKTYKFYIDYMASAQADNNQEQFNKALDLAKTAIMQSDVFSDEAKKSEIYQIDQKAGY